MKAIGIQIKSNEAILVVLSKDANGTITQSKESCKFDIADPNDNTQVKQFRDQINAAFDSIGASKIGVVARNANARGRMAPSPVSFKLEGVIQLYDKVNVEIVWTKTSDAYFKRNPKTDAAANKYQVDAFDVAYYLLKK